MSISGSDITSPKCIREVADSHVTDVLFRQCSPARSPCVHENRRHDHSSGNVRVCENEDMFESVGTWWRNLTHRHGDDRNNDDTLDDATNTLLSILPLASIVVDEHDEVIRAHPDAYALGVVRDDAIADDTVASAVHEVRAHGGKKQFSLTTTTLHEPKKAPKAGKPTMRRLPNRR